jgi:hypothetical protein
VKAAVAQINVLAWPARTEENGENKSQWPLPELEPQTTQTRSISCSVQNLL